MYIVESHLQNPEAIGRWDGVYDAKQEKPNCVQKNYLIPNPTVEGEEDCLYLNVYRPLVSLRLNSFNLY